MREPTEASRGDWVRIHRIALEPDERAESLPEDTSDVPLEMWIKGTLVTERAEPGETVTIETVIGREVTGELVEVTPSIPHGFGRLVPELADASLELKRLLEEIES